MRALSRLLSVFLILAVLLGGGLLGGSAPARADFQAFEAVTIFNGAPYEINLDNEGNLWVSDYNAGQIWSITPGLGGPANANYKIYPVGGNPSDARRFGSYFYWVDGEDGKIGRSDLQGATSVWSVPLIKSGLYGTAIDDLGRLWISEEIDYIPPYESHLHRLNPAVGDGELCTYQFTDYLAGGYLAYRDGFLWLFDFNNYRIMRFSTIGNEWVYWTVPYISAPHGMTVDEQGDLWFIDMNLAITRFDPDENKLSKYRLPVGFLPEMITIHEGLVWYTEQSLGSLYDYRAAFGMMAPDIAEITESHTLAPVSITIDPECGYYKPTVSNISPSSGLIDNWTPSTYSTIIESGGWYIHQLPEDADPKGIAYLDNKVWIVDNFRRVLIQAPPKATLRVCKKFDANKDLDLTTEGDWPISGWEMTLQKDSEDPLIQFTGSDGCTRWEGLELGSTYTITEENKDGWSSIGSVGCDPAVFTKPVDYTCTFYNWAQLKGVFLPLVLR